MIQPSYIEAPSEFDRDVFAASVERVARQMCVEMGLNPDQNVEIDQGSDAIPGEYDYDHRCHHMPPVQLQLGASSHQVQPYQYLEYRFVPQWRKYRRQAALALAGWRAVNYHVMVET